MDILISIVQKLIMKFGLNAQKAVTPNCFKINNSTGFSPYSGEKVDLDTEGQERLRTELMMKYGERSDTRSSGGILTGDSDGSKIIRILLVIVIDIFIAGAFVVPAFGTVSGAMLVIYLIIMLVIMLIPPLLIIRPLSAKKNSELSDAVKYGTIELYEYGVSDKLSVSGGKNSSLYIFLGDISIAVDPLIFHTAYKGGKIRCAVVEGGGARYLIAVESINVIDEANNEGGDAVPDAQPKEPTPSEIFDMLVSSKGNTNGGNKKLF